MIPSLTMEQDHPLIHHFNGINIILLKKKSKY
jgi:hypothetical protein